MKVTYEYTGSYQRFMYCVYNDYNRYLCSFDSEDEAIIYAKWYAEQDKSAKVIKMSDKWTITEEFSSTFNERRFFVYKNLDYMSSFELLEEAIEYVQNYVEQPEKKIVWKQ